MSLFSAPWVVQMRDPLGELLGVVEPQAYRYTFDDVVRLSGHACPTVAGAFLLVKVALERLYPGEVPVRGEVAITLPGRVNEGVNGPMGQVFTLLTGAAGENGFQGLGGRFARCGLLHYDPAARGPGIRFQRLSDGKSVTLAYNPASIPPPEGMGADLPLVLSGQADETIVRRFGQAWRARVEAILADGGANTVREV